MDLKAIFSTIQANSVPLKSFGVAKIGVFGSVARGEAKLTSDVDVLVEFQGGKKTFRNFMGTANHLEKILKKEVDLITDSSISPYLKPYIEKEIKYVTL